jgi:hypothetical protein
MDTIVCEELRPPIAEVALPFAIIVDFNAVPGLAHAALPQRSVRHLLAVHHFHKLGRKEEVVLGPGEHRDDEGAPSFGRGVDRRLEQWQRRLKPRWSSWLRNSHA